MRGQANPSVDTFLTIASRRETKRFSGRPLPEGALERILDAGRLAGSGRNRQPWTFVVVPPAAIAPAVYDPANLDGAASAVAIVVRGKGPISFDAGRAAQSMLLAAWSEGIGGTPNGIADEEAARAVLGHDEEGKVATVLAFGYGVRQRDPSRHSAEEWSARAARKPLDEVVRRVT
jgi:nitroreductase